MQRLLIFALGLLGFSLASCVEMYGCPMPVRPPATEEDNSTEDEESVTEGEEENSAEATFGDE